jgi:hypothetical protein
VSDVTIERCFHKAKFHIANEPLQEPEEVEEELITLWERWKELGDKEDDATLDDYVKIDHELPTDVIMTMDDILSSAS